MIEFDTETTGFQWYADELFLVQFKLGDGEPLVLAHPEQKGLIQDALRTADDFRAWNTKFDLHFLDAAGYDLPPADRWHDGMVAARLLDENGPAALKARGERLGFTYRDNEAAVKGWLREENKRRKDRSKETGELFIPATYQDVPWEVMEPYAAEDVELLRQVGQVQDMALSNSPELQELYALEMQVMGALFDAERYGIPVDEAAAARLEFGLAAELEAIEEEAIALAGYRGFNVRSSQQLYQTLKRLGADLSFVTGESMDEENLSTVVHPLARVVERYRATKKMFDRVHPMLHDQPTKGRHRFIAEDGRLHPVFRQVGAVTGRMSATDPNVQNFHRDDLRLRYLVRAEPGHKIVTADLESIELMLFAAYAGEGRLMDAIKEGKDLHTMTADFVGLDDFDRGGGVVEPRRQRGKTFNYSIIYGAGTRSIRKHFRVPQKRAKEMLERYHDAYPEVGRLQRMIEYKLYDRGYVKTAYGRRFHVPPRDAYKAVNYLIQGTAADMLKVSIAELRKQGVPIIAAVHDELVAHVPAKDAKEVAHLIEKALIEHPRITERVAINAEAKIVDRWSDAKTPGYVPDYDREEMAA